MKTTKITIGCDHAGYDLKLKVINHLQARGVEVIDVELTPPIAVTILPLHTSFARISKTV